MKYTDEQLVETAKRFKTRLEWTNREHAKYKAAVNRGLVPACTAHMASIPRQIRRYTDEEIIESAKKFSCCVDWRSEENGPYQAAKNRGLMEQCTTHMTDKRLGRKYTNEEVIEVAKRYKSSGEWEHSKDGRFYHIAQRYGILAQCTAHMPRHAGIYSGIYVIYAYEFPGKVAYIGLTCAPEKRHESHVKSGRVCNEATRQQVPVPSQKILQDRLMSPQQAQAAERRWIGQYSAEGWHLLNISAGGSIGNIKAGKWAKESILNIARQYKTTREWLDDDPASYAVASKHRWTEEATSHMDQPKKWTRERIKAVTSKYTNYTKFSRECPSCASVLSRMGLTHEYTAHMQRKFARRTWTDEEIFTAAKPFKTVAEWKASGCKSYGAALHRGRDFYLRCKAHMVKAKPAKKGKQWTREECIQHAKQYKTRNTWHQANQMAYQWAKRLGVFEECVRHMPKYGRVALPFKS